MKLTLMYNVLLLVMFPVSENNVRLLQEIIRKKIECLTRKNPLAFALKTIVFKNKFSVLSDAVSHTVVI